jgi:hypothetical protein
MHLVPAKIFVSLSMLLLCFSSYAEELQIDPDSIKQLEEKLQEPSPKIENLEEPKAESDNAKNETQIDRRNLNKANEIIHRMRNSDPAASQYVSLRMGAIQILSNTTGLETSPDKTLLTTGLDANFAIWGNLYFDLSYAHHTNTLNPSQFSLDDSSLADLYQTSTDVGLKYRFILDETKPSNFLGISLKAHNTTNNFKVADTSTGIIITQYDGWVIGVEKGIPITPSLGIDASLDMISINKVSEISDFSVSNSGVGFVVKGDVYYTSSIFGYKYRASLSYWQSGMVNEFSDSDKELFDRQNQVQTYRMITGALGIVF